MRFRWRFVSREELGARDYVPSERCRPAIDPLHDRVYVGTSEGRVYGLNGSGGIVFRYHAGSSVESQFAIDTKRQELYFGTDAGMVHAVDANKGKRRWRVNLGASIRAAPTLSHDALFVVTETDVVFALDRKDGEILWRYQRELPGGMNVEGHSGITHVGDLVVLGMTDGTVVALNENNGELRWELDTSEDVEEPIEGLPRFIDVDTTPVLTEEGIFIASIAGGLYLLSPQDGSLRWRNSTITGVFAIESTGTELIMASADLGLIDMRVADKRVMWRRTMSRGISNLLLVEKGLVLTTESTGGIVARVLTDGHEIGRIDPGLGFTAQPVYASGRGFALSNAAVLYAFEITKPKKRLLSSMEQSIWSNATVR